MIRITVASLAVFLLAACGGGDGGGSDSGDDDIDPSQPGMSRYAKVIDASDAILETGFAQDEDYVNAVAILENPLDDPKHGHEVDVAFELVDAEGKVIGSETAHGAFAWVGQRTALTVQLETSERVASVTATAKLRVASDPKGTPVEPAEGRLSDGFAELTLHNPRREPLHGFELVVVCRDGKKAISGVGSEDVDDRVPAGAEGKFSVPIVGVGPSGCVGYPGVGI